MSIKKLSYVQVIGYCRISTESQKFGCSVETQTNIIRQFCESNDIIDNLELYTETASAYKDNDKKRHIFHGIINNISKDSLIIIHDISRFSRNYQESLNVIEFLIDKNVNVISILERCDILNNYKEFLRYVQVAEMESNYKSVKLKTFHMIKTTNRINHILTLIQRNNIKELLKYKKTELKKAYLSNAILDYVYNKNHKILKKIFQHNNKRKYICNNTIDCHQLKINNILGFWIKTIGKDYHVRVILNKIYTKIER